MLRTQWFSLGWLLPPKPPFRADRIFLFRLLTKSIPELPVGSTLLPPGLKQDPALVKNPKKAEKQTSLRYRQVKGSPEG